MNIARDITPTTIAADQCLTSTICDPIVRCARCRMEWKAERCCRRRWRCDRTVPRCPCGTRNRGTNGMIHALADTQIKFAAWSQGRSLCVDSTHARWKNWRIGMADSLCVQGACRPGNMSRGMTKDTSTKGRRLGRGQCLMDPTEKATTLVSETIPVIAIRRMTPTGSLLAMRRCRVEAWSWTATVVRTSSRCHQMKK